MECLNAARYKKDELPGKNISVLMGAPYNQVGPLVWHRTARLGVLRSCWAPSECFSLLHSLCWASPDRFFPPVPQLHAGYVKRYLQTQKSTILDTQRRLEGKHKNGKLFPMAIRVTRIESAGGAERLHTLWPHMSSSGVESVPQIYPPLVEQRERTV